MDLKRTGVASALLLAGLLVAESAGSIEITAGPTLTLNPNVGTPLAASLELTTDTPARVILSIHDGVGTRTVAFPGFATEHSLAVLGLRPDTTHSIDVTIFDQADEGLFLPPLQITTAPLPADFPVMTVLASDPSRMEPGYTLLDFFSRARGGSDQRYSVIVDARGDVVWYSLFGESNMRQLPNGHLQYMELSELIEIDMLGVEKSRVVLLESGLGLHHDISPTADGTFLTISRETVSIDDVPTSETDPLAPRATTDVRDEPIREFLPTGELVESWRLTDIIDPTRIGYDALRPSSSGVDWAHANAVFHDSRDDSIVVSVRHQDAVIKFSRATGELIWILGSHANWAPEFQPYLLQPVGQPFEWQYHQHSPVYTPSGTLLLFDNGNHRADPFDGTMPDEPVVSHSRAVEYEIDEERMEVRQVWEYGDQTAESIYSGAMGDADWLPGTGNVMMTFSFTTFTNGDFSPDLGFGAAHTRIIEVDHGTPAEKVFDLRLHDPDGGTTSGIRVYRSDRIPSLYGESISEETYVTGLTPITDLGDGLYKGLQGGQYPPGGLDMRPAAHDDDGLLQALQVVPRAADGSGDPVNGQIVLLSIGGTNTFYEFSAFSGLADGDPERDPQVRLVNGAQLGHSVQSIADPSNAYWQGVDARLAEAGVTAEQVQAVWIKASLPTLSPAFPDYALTLAHYLSLIAEIVEARFPAGRLAYLSSDTFGGYGSQPLGSEPRAYETGFAVQQLIKAQIAGIPELNFKTSGGDVVVPWLGWGPYLWADGPMERSDGLTWQRNDFGSDGVTPSLSGASKVAGLLSDFFRTDATARSWYLAAPSPMCPEQAIVDAYGIGAAAGQSPLPIVASILPTLPSIAPLTVQVTGTAPLGVGFFLVGEMPLDNGQWPLAGGSLLVVPEESHFIVSDALGRATLDFGTLPPGGDTCGEAFSVQFIGLDAAASEGLALTRGLRLRMGH